MKINDVTGRSVSRKKWLIAAPFFSSSRDTWIDDFIVPSEEFEFQKIPSPAPRKSWHSRKRRNSGFSEWMGYWNHCREIFRNLGENDGIITLFPQLALVSSVQKILFRKKNVIIAYCFNIGAPPGRWQRRLGRLAFRACDAIVVHSSAEIGLVSKWFDLDEARIRFFPLQCGEINASAPVVNEPYLIAMGSANRDYPVLIRAVAQAGIKTVIVAAPRIVEELDRPANVEFRFNLSMEECRSLVAGARLSVIPLIDGEASSGQVTLIEAMRLGCPTVTTATIGTIDYVRDGETGFLVPAGDHEGLAKIIERLWSDDLLRRDLSARAQGYAQTELSDEAAASRLEALLIEMGRSATV